MLSKSTISKSTIVVCILLTAIVLHTCIQIEVLNARSGYFLPRKLSRTGNPKWRVAAKKTLFKTLERTIALDRSEAHFDQHPNGPAPDFQELEELSGPPYLDAEQAWIDNQVALYELNSKLRDWVGGMGLLQYLLAPIALLWSLWLFRIAASWAERLLVVGCTISNLTSTYLMFYRGYFESLGW